MSSLRSLLLFFTFLCAANAQHRDYRVSLSDNNFGDILITNYYGQPLESLHFQATCGAGSTSFDRDTLDSGMVRSRRPLLNQRGESPLLPGPVMPGERVYERPGLAPQPSGCTYTYDVTAALFADGTWQGDEEDARVLAARRDGLRDAAHFWSEKLNGKTGTWPPDAVAIARQDTARSFGGACRPSRVQCSYWSGWAQVDRGIALRATEPNTPQDTHKAELAEANRWQDKATSLTSTTKLDAAFPLPQELRNAAAQRNESYPDQPSSSTKPRASRSTTSTSPASTAL